MIRFTLSLLFALFVVLNQIGHADDVLKVGVAKTDITPPLGWRMCGYFNERMNAGTKDPLHAKAIAWVQGETKVVFIACDLIGLSSSITAEARKQIEARTGTPAAHIVVHGTHSHTGPLYGGAMREYFHSKAIERDGKDAAEPIDYPKFLAEKIAEAAEQAITNAKPATLESGIGEETALSFNRRWHLTDGTVQFNPGRGNPKLVRPAGPIDPDLGIMLVRDTETKQPMASLTSFALHLDTVGGTLYAADYPYYLEQGLQKQFGANFLSIFGTGTCGDINHVDFHLKEAPKFDKIESDRIGSALAKRVLETVPLLEQQTRPMLAVKRAAFEAPKQQYPPERFAIAQRDMAKIGTNQASFLEQVETVKIVELGQWKKETIEIEVQAIRLTPDTAIVAIPGEVFVQLGLMIKLNSPFKTTLVIELCNDSPAYLPTKRAFVEGSYETINSRTVPGTGEKMVATAIELLESLKP
jgi:neutral ceramidase